MALIQSIDNVFRSNSDVHRSEKLNANISINKGSNELESPEFVHNQSDIFNKTLKVNEPIITSFFVK